MSVENFVKDRLFIVLYFIALYRIVLNEIKPYWKHKI